MQFVNGMNTSYVQIRNELASEQLIKVQFQVAMSGRYTSSIAIVYKLLKKDKAHFFLCPKQGHEI